MKEQTRVHHKNDHLWWLRDPQHSLGDTKKTGKGSTTTMPIPPLWDAPRGSPKCRILAAKLTDLRKRMEGYRKEEHLQKLQEEQDLHDALANTECDTEMAGKGSMQTV